MGMSTDYSEEEEVADEDAFLEEEEEDVVKTKQIPYRFDMCHCERLLKCPNGTTMSGGAKNIFGCKKSGAEVLRRMVPIPKNAYHRMRLINASERVPLSGTGSRGIGFLQMEAFETAIVTINATQLTRNFTYNADYQISVYVDCDPCPARYRCARGVLKEGEAPKCDFPSERRQAEIGYMCSECCLCKREKMPFFFEDTTGGLPMSLPRNLWRFEGYPDSKHDMLQISVHALHPMKMTICLELVNGLYYGAFERDFAGKGDLYVHTPSRSLHGETDSFLAIIQEPDFASMSIPMNIPGILKFEEHVLIDRIADINVGDPTYFERLHALKSDVLEEEVFYNDSNISSPSPSIERRLLVNDGYDNNAEAGEDATTGSTSRMRRALLQDNVMSPSPSFIMNMSNLTNFTNITIETTVQENVGRQRLPFVVRDNEGSDASWWSKGDSEKYPDGLSFIALTYMPFFSNCRGYDNHIYLNKLFERHPECTRVPNDANWDDPKPASTQYVAEWPWEGLLVSQSDYCYFNDPAKEAELAYNLNQGIVYTQEYINQYQAVQEYLAGIEEDRLNGDLEPPPDKYEIKLSCTYEEDIKLPAPLPRWYEKEEETILFYVSRYGRKYDEFKVVPPDPTRGLEFGEGWGRTSVLEADLNSEEYLQVKLGENAGLENLVPRTIKMEFTYYQMANHLKRLVAIQIDYLHRCSVSENQADLLVYSRLIPPVPKCVWSSPIDDGIREGGRGDYNYVLEILYYPLDWLELMNQFQFTTKVYIVFFILVGLLTVLIGMIVYGFNRLITRLKHPPAFRFKQMLKIVVPPPTKGVILASLPVLMGWFIIYGWFVMTRSVDVLGQPTFQLNFEPLHADWLNTAVMTVDDVETYRMGRIACAVMGMGMYIIFLGGIMFVPNNQDDMALDDINADEVDPEDVYDDEDDEDDMIASSPFWTPLLWKHTHMLLSCFMITIFLMIIWEFSYSHHFANHVYEFIVIFKVIQMLLDQAFAYLLRENLLIAAIMTSVEVTEIMITMGAEDFMDFSLSYFIEMVVMIAERIYLDPGLKKMAKLYPKWKIMFKRRFQKKRQMTREQRAKEEAEWKRVNEEIALESEGVEPLLDSYGVYANEALALCCTPVIQAFMYLYIDICKMPILYGIKATELYYYMIFSIVTVPFTFFADMFLLHTQELAHGWKVYDFIAYQRYRFSVRETRWQMSNFDTLDESIAEPLQSLDMLAFSEQYYFMSSLLGYGILTLMFGFTIMLRFDYNIFGDIAFPTVWALVFIMAGVLNRLLRKCADLGGLWIRKSMLGTVDDDIAAKLAIGEGRQEDLEAERLELQAMNSERFRHRFLDKNRPWILQHMVELLTPRTLQMPGPDGRPTIEYIRDVYMDLVNMGEGRRRPGDRGDISSDSGEDELAAQRREWSKAPLSKSSAALLRYWLERARKRRKLMKLVQGTMQNAIADACAICGKTAGSGVRLLMDLANETGDYDPTSLDRLIEGYDEKYEGQPFNGNLWQSYFRQFAKFITRCHECIDRLEQARMHKDVRHPGAGRGARPGDISSDHDDYEVAFDPIVVSRVSIEGRMMSKWLQAARKRLGGDFPRPGAREEMEIYAQKMRDRKLGKTKKKKKRGAMGEEDSSDDDGPDSWPKKLHLRAATKALAVRWLKNARTSRDKRHKEKCDNLMEDLAVVLGGMPDTMDWYFSAELRLEGENLKEEGRNLGAERRRAEADMQIKCRAILDGLAAFRAEKEEQKQLEVEKLERKMDADRKTAMREADERIEALTKRKVQAKQKFQKELEFCPDEQIPTMKRQQAEEMEELEKEIKTERARSLAMLEKKMSASAEDLGKKQVKRDEAIKDRERSAQEKVASMKKKCEVEMQKKEQEWLNASSGWLFKARAKIEKKKIEDEEAAKRERNKKKRRRR